MTKAQKAEQQEAITQLREWLKPGDTVHTILDHVSSSGMSRAIRFVILKCDGGEVFERHPNYAIGRVLELRHRKVNGREQDALVVSGGGMDMGFHCVYGLSRRLFPDGFAPSNLAIRPSDGKTVNVNIGRGRNAGPLTKAEVEALTAKGWKFTGGRNGDTSGWDNDGGYALKHRWL